MDSSGIGIKSKFSFIGTKGKISFTFDLCCAGMTCHARPEFATFSQFHVCFNVNQAKRTISLLPLNHFYPVRSIGKESDELLYTVRSLVMVRGTSCQRKEGVNKLLLLPIGKNFWM